MNTRESAHRGGFTLTELMVAVGLMVILIVSIGVVFKSASTAVGLSEATDDIFAKARAINQQIQMDVHGMDKQAFIAIRNRKSTRTSAVGSPLNPWDDPNFHTNQTNRYYDQICFFSQGRFPNKAGAYQNTSLFADSTAANEARIWYGQLVVEKDTGTGSEDQGVPLNALPTSTVNPTSTAGVNADDPTLEGGYILGRQAMLLLNAPEVTTFPAGYSDIDVNPAVAVGTPPANAAISAITLHSQDSGAEAAAVPHIMRSRISAAYTNVPSIINRMSAQGYAGNPQVQTLAFCYRLATLPSPNSTGVPDSSGGPYLPNGAFRMSPIWAQGVASFQVEWTDGQTQTTETPTLTRLKWYPYTDGTSGTNDHVPTGARDPSSYDDHMYLFGQGGDAFPVALKFTYRLTDPNNRLNGGRTFVCVVDIP